MNRSNTLKNRKNRTGKAQAVSGYVLNAIRQGEYQPGGVLPSEMQLSEDLDVSRVTVRAALTALRDHGVIVSHPGRGWQVVESTDSDKKVVFFSGIQQSSLIFDAMSETCERSNVVCLHKPCPANNQFLDSPEAKLAISGGANGVAIFLDAHPNETFIEFLRSWGQPVVLIGYWGHAAFDSLCCDFVQGGRMLVDHLYRTGHRRIVFFELEGLWRRVPSFLARRAGFEIGMEEHGLAPEVLTMNGHFHSRLDSEAVFEKWLAGYVARHGGRPDALILSACEEAAPMAKLLMSVGFRMPQDISLCSFGLPDYPVVGGTVDFASLTVFEEPWAAIGGRAAEMLICQQKHPSESPALTLVPSTIRHGDSVANRTE